MKVKTRTILVLTGTILIGIIIGAIGSNTIRMNHIKSRMEGFRNPDRFISRIENEIQPTPEQKDRLLEILSEHHKKMMKGGEELHRRIQASTDSLRSSLDTILTREQMEKMEKLFKRRDRFIRPDSRRHEKEESR